MSSWYFWNKTADKLPVRRITWLREKDRVQRWKEQIILCRTDLECSERWFKHQFQVWDERLQLVEAVEKPGHICYAEKQKSNWASLAQRASGEVLWAQEEVDKLQLE